MPHSGHAGLLKADLNRIQDAECRGGDPPPKTLFNDPTGNP